VKNKLPGGIDKKIPARFFHQIQLGWTARAGGGGRKPDGTRGGPRARMYIHTARGWVYRHGGGLYGGSAPGGYQLIRNTPARYPPGTVGCHGRQQWLKCNLPLTSSPDHVLLPPLYCNTATVLQQYHHHRGTATAQDANRCLDYSR